FRPSRSSLRRSRQTGNWHPGVKRQYRRSIRMQRRCVSVTYHQLSNVANPAEAVRIVNPPTRSNTQIIEEAPLSQCHIDDQGRRVAKLLVGSAQVLGHV